MTRLLAIDLGRRRIGAAIADTESGAVEPFATLTRRTIEHDAQAIRTLVAEQSIDELVVGLPRHLDGREGEQALETRQWAEQIQRSVALPLVWQDERLTSVQAETRLGGPPRGRGGGPPSRAALRRHRASIDREAASLIAQAALDARQKAAPPQPAE